MKRIRFFLVLTLSFLMLFGLSSFAKGEAVLGLNQHCTAYADSNSRLSFSFTPEDTGIYTFCVSTLTGESSYLYVNMAYSNDSYFADNSSDGTLILDGVLFAGAAVNITLDIECSESSTFDVWIQPVDHSVFLTDQWYHEAAYGSSETLSVYTYNPSEENVYAWYEVVDMDTYERTPIQGADQSAYTIASVVKSTYYECDISTPDGIWLTCIRFSVHIPSNVTASPVGSTTLYVSPLQPFTLSVQAAADYGEINYKWLCYGSSTEYSWTEIEGENGPSLTVDSQTANYMQYQCYVWDYDWSDSDRVYFYVYLENHLSVSADTTNYQVSPGESVELSVNARCDVGDLHYVWNIRDYSRYSYGEWVALEGETGASLVLNNIQSSGNYRVEVTDDYGNSESKDFYVVIPNGLRISRVTPYDVYVPAGGNVTLSARASCAVGDVSYQWYHSGDVIPGATQSAYTCVSPVNEDNTFTYYACYAEDQYHNSTNVSFSINLASGLCVWADCEDWMELKPEETAVLRVAVNNPDQTPLTYQWSREGALDTEPAPIEGANEPALTVIGRGGYASYICTVTDAAGQTDSVWFSVYVKSGLLVGLSCDGAHYFGETAALHATAISDYSPITYQWYQSDGDGYLPIEGADGADYTTETLTRDSYTEYKCVVFDGYEMKEAWIDLEVMNPDVTVTPVGDTEIFCQEGETITLAVSVTGASDDEEFSIYWYKGSDSVDDDPHEASYSFMAAAGNAHYRCIAYVDGHEYIVTFHVYTASVPVWSLNEQVSVSSSRDEPAVLSFTPEHTGMYAFSVLSGELKNSGRYWTLYDSAWNDITRSYDSAFSWLLTGGEKYYIEMTYYREGTRSGTLLLSETSASRTGAFTLIAGQTFLFPSQRQYSNYVSSSVSDAPGVVMVQGDIISAVSPGFAHVTVTYDNGYQAAFSVTVVSGVQVVRIPSSTGYIQAEAFQGDHSIQYVVLGDCCFIGSKAFQGTNLVQIVFSGPSYYDPYVASDAFSGASPLIVGPGYLQDYAIEHGFEFLLVRPEEGGNG